MSGKDRKDPNKNPSPVTFHRDTVKTFSDDMARLVGTELETATTLLAKAKDITICAGDHYSLTGTLDDSSPVSQMFTAIQQLEDAYAAAHAATTADLASLKTFVTSLGTGATQIIAGYDKAGQGEDISLDAVKSALDPATAPPTWNLPGQQPTSATA